MSYFDDASLVMIPSGYKTSKVYSVKPTDGSGDLTFSRSNDTATRVGPDGLIEKVRTNQALYSEDFTNAYWIKTNAAITGNTIANPIDGALTADTFTPTNVSATNRIRSASISLSSAGMSIYVKANGYTKVGIREDITSGNYASYDLSSGTILDSSGAVSPTITALTNGWYRISLGVTASPVGMGVWILDPTYTTGTFSTSNWTADGTSGIYVFGAQIEGGDIATPYIGPTLAAAVSVGPVANVPRLDYLNSSCPRLLLEPQRTNLLTFSEQQDNAAWSKSQSSVTANVGVSPDGFTNADKLIPNTTSNIHALQQSIADTAASWTYSVFAKSAGYDRIILWVASTNFVGFNLSTGVVESTLGTNVTSANIQNYGNGWYRCSITSTSTSSLTSVSIGVFNAAYTNGNTNPIFTGNGTDGILVYGAQFEAGAYATSYIPTLGAAVTRGADACYKTGVSSLIGQTEGVFFFDYVASAKNIDASNYAVLFIVGTSLDNFQIYNGGTSLNWYARSSAGIALDKSAGQTLVAGQRYKIAFAYKAGSYALYINGVQKSTDTSAIVPAASQFNLNATGLGASPATVENKFNQVLFFPTRLTNAQLAELTTI